MPTLDAVDYSFSRPDPTALKAAGIRAVARYLTGSGTKPLVRAEASRLHACGMGIVLCFEHTADSAFAGGPAGARDRAVATGAARTLDVPAGTAIYYAVDREVTNRTQMSAVLDYRRAAEDSVFPARLYGQASVLDAAGIPGWQTRAWSRSRISAYAVLYQYLNGQKLGGGLVDFNHIIDERTLAAWWPEEISGPNPPPDVNSMSLDELAQLVLTGRYGNGEARERALGDRYEDVQRRVNQMRDTASPTSASISISLIVDEVIAGKWGNNPEREQRLTAAGHNAKDIQAEVNRKLRG